MIFGADMAISVSQYHGDVAQPGNCEPGSWAPHLGSDGSPKYQNIQLLSVDYTAHQ
jgi:hypothetical protein